MSPLHICLFYSFGEEEHSIADKVELFPLLLQLALCLGQSCRLGIIGLLFPVKKVVT